jgi:hypothetical protein
MRHANIPNQKLRSKTHNVHLHSEAYQSNNSSKPSNSTPKPVSNTSQPMGQPAKNLYCFICQNKEHRVDNCNTFQNMRRSQKFAVLKRKHACFTCLDRFHSWRKCLKNKNLEEPKLHPCLVKTEESDETSLTHYDGEKKVHFRVVPVTIVGPKGKLDTYAVFDEGSSVTLIEEKVAQQLGLQANETGVAINLPWTQNTRKELKCDKVTCDIAGTEMNKHFKMRNIHTVPGLNLPIQSLDGSVLKEKYPYLKQTEIKSYHGVHPVMLIGLEHSKLGTPLQVREGSFSDPIAFKTRYMDQNFMENQQRNTTHCLFVNASLIYMI